MSVLRDVLVESTGKVAGQVVFGPISHIIKGRPV
jgi:hypothetical protein